MSSKRPLPQQLSLPDKASFPSMATQLPERLRPPPLQQTAHRQQISQQVHPGYDAHHADSPQEVPIACENMFNEKPSGGSSSFMPGDKDDEKPVKRRMRGITSCLECRRRKMKCGRTQPCDHCHKSGRVCIYLGDRLDPDSQGKITEIKEKVSSLELQLQKSVVHQRIGSGLLGSDVPAYSLDPAESGLEISHMVTSDLIYDHADYSMDDDEDEDEATNDMIDLGFKVGRMRMTERIGGLNRPRLAEEINVALASKPGSFGFNLAPPGNSPCMPRSREPGREDSNGGYTAEKDNVVDSDLNSTPIPDFLRPSCDYITPSSGALFGHLTAVPPAQKLLPSSWICDYLKNTYFANVHPIASCLHQPTFEQQFSEFLILVDRGRQPRRPRQALVFAVLFSGIVAADADEIAARFSVRKADLVTLVKYGVEASLGKANLLRTTSVEAMQAFVIYLVALCRDEVSRSHSILVGAAIRMAECMALHRDGSAFGLTPLETHVRRLIWHQLCFLDIRTCEAQGPRPTIHREDYDTFLPYNCDDEDLTLEGEAAAFTSRPSWAASFLVVLRFEVNEMMRVIWIDRFKLERRKTHLTIVMAKIEKFCHRLNQKYEGYLDDSTPIKRFTKLVKELFICRMHVMVLHPYHSNTSNPLSERLHCALIQSGIRIIEIGIELETNQEFAQWRWYLGAFMQYQIALLLTTEAFHGHSISEAGRIGKCLDYVFDTEHSQSLYEKAQGILYEVMQKSATYCEFRKLRAPTTTKQAVPQAQLAQSNNAPTSTMPPIFRPHRGTPVLRREMAVDVDLIKEEMFSPAAPSVPNLLARGSGMVSEPQVEFQLPTQQYQQHVSQLYSQQKQQLRYETSPNGREDIPRGMAPGTANILRPDRPYAFNAQTQPTVPIVSNTNGNNMVFSGVANGEALWGHPQVVSADSPETFGSEWAGNPTHQQQDTELSRHQYPYTAAYKQCQEGEANLLDGISWDDLNTMLPKSS